VLKSGTKIGESDGKKACLIHQCNGGSGVCPPLQFLLEHPRDQERCHDARSSGGRELCPRKLLCFVQSTRPALCSGPGGDPQPAPGDSGR
jgi:hypothetical protein